MTRDDNSETRPPSERLDQLEKRLTGIERTTNSIHDLLQARLRRRWREKFRPRLWHYRQYAPTRCMCRSAYAMQTAPEKAPRIAIVTPSYNHARYLRATIDSVLAQSYPNLAYWSRTAARRTERWQLLESYGDQIAWRSERDAGQGSAINRGFARIDGEIMAYLNSDDILLPGALAYVAQTFLAKPDSMSFMVIGFSSMRTARKSVGGCFRRTTRRPSNGRTISRKRPCSGAVGCGKRSGPIDESFRYALDWDFALRAQAAGFRFNAYRGSSPASGSTTRRSRPR